MLKLLPEQPAANGEAAARINQCLLQQARYSGLLTMLASPHSGGGVTVSRFSQLFMLRYLAGDRTVDAMAQQVHSLLQQNRERVVHEGKMLESDAAQLAHLQGLAQRFLADELPLLGGMGILPPG
jgi:hypothetical protein